MGLVEKAANRPAQAMKAFARAHDLDGNRYDAAVELASQHVRLHEYGPAVALLETVLPLMQESPRYLDMAGTIYSNVGLPERAWPLFQRAVELQPDADSIRARLAECSVHIGRVDDARAIYEGLLRRIPNHQRNHYELSRLGRAPDATHVDEMLGLLETSSEPPARNVYLYYALGKELEDLERWDEAFDFYRRAGDAAASVADYDVRSDVATVDTVIETCTTEWLGDAKAIDDETNARKAPIFVVGLPRTGTTLTERILSSHSQIETIGETFFMQIALKHASRIVTADAMNADIVRAAAGKDATRIGADYLRSVAYKFGDKPLFIEKFPENFLYLGFIAKALPGARLVHLRRNPMDACFAMYKQSFFRYAYTLDDLGAYYLAYHRLGRHWREVLGKRLVEVDYERLVGDQEVQTRKLLEALDLEFEDACLSFELNRAASNTASSVQIREKAHTRSVNRWKRYEEQLQPLRNCLEAGGVKVE